MTRRIAVVLALIVSLSPGMSPAGAAQQAPAKRDQDPVLRARVELVSVFATVRDNKRRILADLSQDDFAVLENDQPQKIEFFSRETNLPITLGLLIDTSISQERVLSVEQDSAMRFLTRVLTEKDLAFVLTFDINVDLLGDFTNDRQRLERAIQRARINRPLPDGPIARRGPVGTRLFDAIYSGTKEKLASEVGRKALVLLTDGVDAGSQVTMQEALEAAQRADVVIHVIGISDYQFYGSRGGFGGGGEGVCRKLAEETGGRSIFVNNEKDLEKAFDQISEELRSQYTLGYYSANKTRDGAFRKIKVETTRKDSKVLARKGYYAGRN